MAEAGEGTNPNISLPVQRYATQFINAVDGYQLRPGPSALPHLHQHVGTAGDNLGLGVFQPQTDRILNAPRLIQRFQIIHDNFPPYSKPAS